MFEDFIEWGKIRNKINSRNRTSLLVTIGNQPVSQTREYSFSVNFLLLIFNKKKQFKM